VEERSTVGVGATIPKARSPDYKVQLLITPVSLPVCWSSGAGGGQGSAQADLPGAGPGGDAGRQPLRPVRRQQLSRQEGVAA